LSAPSLPAFGPLPLRPVIMVALALVYVSVLVQWHKMK